MQVILILPLTCKAKKIKSVKKQKVIHRACHYINALATVIIQIHDEFSYDIIPVSVIKLLIFASRCFSLRLKQSSDGP